MKRRPLSFERTFSFGSLRGPPLVDRVGVPRAYEGKREGAGGGRRPLYLFVLFLVILFFFFFFLLFFFLFLLILL